PASRRLVSEIPAEVDRIVRRCLEKRPRDRFEDLTSVQSLLVRALRDRTTLPRELLLARALAEAGLAHEVAPPRERHLDRSTIFEQPLVRRGGILAGVVVASL